MARRTSPIAFLILSILSLAACVDVPQTEAPDALSVPAWPTLDTLATPLPSPTPLPEWKTLTICAGSEPTSLYLYNESNYITDAILEAIYDGPIDWRNFGYQPVILEELPSSENGGMVIELVEVREGDWVVDDNGDRIQLAQGSIVRPAGCRSEACAQTYADGALSLERMSVTFHLLEGLEWSDGISLKASDSVFSYNLAVQPDTPYGINGLVSQSVDSLLNTAAYTALDDRTVQWQGLPGFIDPNYAANFFIPLPEHVLKPYDPLQLVEMAGYLPVGWGAYRPILWDAGERLVLERNPNYFLAGQGLPYFDRLVFRFLTGSVAQRLETLDDGTCDILLSDAIPLENLAQAMPGRDAGSIAVYSLPEGMPLAWEQLSFNTAPVDGSQRPAFFREARLRKAIASCIDRPALAQALYGDLAPVMDTYLPPGHPLLETAEIATYPFDPAAGTALLEEIGWRDTDGDGIREAHGVAGIKASTPLQLELVTSDAPLRQTVAALIATNLESCGVGVTVREVAGYQFLMKDAEAPVYGRNFDMALFSWQTGLLPPCDLALSSKIPSEVNAWSGRNVTGYSNPGYDVACQGAQIALPGTTQYLAGQRDALRIFSQDLPFLPLFLRVRFGLARPDLLGLIPDLTQGNELWNIEAFRLEP